MHLTRPFLREPIAEAWDHPNFQRMNLISSIAFGCMVNLVLQLFLCALVTRFVPLSSITVAFCLIWCIFFAAYYRWSLPKAAANVFRKKIGVPNA